MKFLCILIIAFLISGQSYAQECNCPLTLDALVKKVETNYVGFLDRITDSTKAHYLSFTDSLRSKAQSSKGYECKQILAAWTDFFHDPHLRIVPLVDGIDKKQVRALFADWPRKGWSEKQTKAYLDQPGRDSIEGIWEMPDGKYKVGVIRERTNASSFIAFILKGDSLYWMPGQIKMRISKKGKQYRVILYKLDHMSETYAAHFTNDCLQLNENIFWIKKYPVSSSKSFSSSTSSVYSPRFEKINADVNLLVLPSFNVRYKKEIDRLIKIHQDEIRNTSFLVIDIRNNAGGTNSTFEELIPYLYTNPIQIKSASAWATQDNIGVYEEVLQSAVDPKEQQELREMIEKMKAHREELVCVYPKETIIKDTVYAHPVKIAVLINNGTASSGELFLERAKQSKKVIIFGQPTLGAIDYTDITDPIPLSCSLYGLIYPTIRSDDVIAGQVGRFLPDIAINHLQNSKWLDFVIEWMKKFEGETK